MYAWQSELAGRSRLVFPGSSADGRAAGLTGAELAILASCGLIAAAGTLFLDFSLRVPGHAILRAVLPMAVGLALVPRRGAGTTMAVVAGTTAGVCGLGGWNEAGFGATTSLLLIGPLLDLAARRASRVLPFLVAFALAGLGTNLAALVVRGTARWLVPHGRPFEAWIVVAGWSYPLCGFVAGLVSAAVCFRWTSRRSEGPDEPPAAESTP